jgi:hypothetical protein
MIASVLPAWLGQKDFLLTRGRPTRSKSLRFSSFTLRGILQREFRHPTPSEGTGQKFENRLLGPTNDFRQRLQRLPIRPFLKLLLVTFAEG